MAHLVQRARANEIAARLNDVACAVVAERTAELGLAGAGVSGEYPSRVSRKDILGVNERYLCEYIATLAEFTEVLEVGSGFGGLPLLLGAMGMRSRGVEAMVSRHETAAALRQAWGRVDPAGAGRVTLVNGRFPDVVANDDLSGSLVLVVDMLSDRMQGKVQAFVAALARGTAVIIEMSRFVERVNAPEKQEELVYRLMELGLGPAVDLFTSRGGRFVLFDKRKVAAVQSPGRAIG